MNNWLSINRHGDEDTTWMRRRILSKWSSIVVPPCGKLAVMRFISSQKHPYVFGSVKRKMQTELSYGAFTPDTCSPDTSCIHLYPFESPVAVYMYPVSATKLSLTQHYGDMYAHVSGYKLLVRDTCIRLHVFGVNAALQIAMLLFLIYLSCWLVRLHVQLKRTDEWSSCTDFNKLQSCHCCLYNIYYVIKSLQQLD